MFSKHLPPSAAPSGPRVLAFDESSAAELPDEIELTRGDPETPGEFDAVVGCTAPDGLAARMRRLRPGGRLILAQRADPEGSGQARLLLDALTAAGFIHCLVEPVGDFIVYRGERPPQGSSVERVQTLAAPSPSPYPTPLRSGGNYLQSPFVFLLIIQTPNRPAWTPPAVSQNEKVEWRAVTILDPATGQPALLAFSSLVKAVAFMQSAILAKWISGVNKVGKFRSEVGRTWELPLILNPTFDDLRSTTLGSAYKVDLKTAILGGE